MMCNVKSFSYHIIFTTRLRCPNDHQLERKRKNKRYNLSILNKQLVVLALQLAEFIGLSIKHHWSPATPRAFSPKLPAQIARAIRHNAPSF